MTRPRCFLDVSIGDEPAGRLIIELFSDKAPKTAENFRQLCSGEHDGLSYAKAPFHRVVDEFMIQGGDIENGDGTGVKSIYGGAFEDEDLRWREIDAAGLVCAANRGKGTNGSQFFITLEPSPHLNGRHTLFGQLVGSQDTLERISQVEVDSKDRPLAPVLISRCGELERRKKNSTKPAEKNANSQQRDRGRSRRSNSGDVVMENSPEPPRPHYHRRTSDNLVDEGLRGRPRNRSGSRSQSRHTPSDSESEDSDRGSSNSQTYKQKRKRSPSPSRHAEAEGHRRRRSLPNQYGDERYHRTYEDEQRYKPSPRRDDHQHNGHRRDDHGRKDDRYRPSRERNPYSGDEGRLGGSGGYDDPPVKFKGRGVMKYREPGRL